MSRPIVIEAGRRTGMLVMLAEAGSNRFGKRLVRCACDCGSESIVIATRFAGGKVNSCGCLARQAGGKRERKDIAGQTFHRLKAIAPEGANASRKVLWRCLCECGATAIVCGRNLRSGKTKSCGCLKLDVIRERGARRRQPMPVSRTLEYKRAANSTRRRDPTYAMHSRISRLVRWALDKRNAMKKSRTMAMLGYSKEDLVRHIERQFVDGMGWENMNEWHIDHIVPIKTAQTVSDVIALNQLSNLRPIWASENMKKQGNRQFLL